MSAGSRERSASSVRSYYKNYEQQKQRKMSSGDSLNSSTEKDSAALAAAARLRSAARQNSAYRMSDPLDNYYSSDYVIHKPLASVYGSRWTLSHEELLRQLNEERARIKDLELVRARQTASIGELEAELRKMRINGYEDAPGLAEENNQLRRDNARLQDEVLQLRAGRDIPSLEYTSRLENAEERVRVLEQQLVDEAHQWEIERSRLLGDLPHVDRRWLTGYSSVLPPVYSHLHAPRYMVYRD